MQAENAASLTSVPYQRLYSAGGIRLLSLFFNTIVGGVMAFQNLKDVRQPKTACVVLWGSIGYTIIVLFLVARLTGPPASIWLSWTFNILGGLGLEAYCRRFIPEWQTAPLKSNFKPIMLCLGIFALLFGLLFSLAGHANRPLF
ncbi:hypothetical protein ACFP2F_15055 [Hymenobacter artigasi]|uniref:Uncharacterized protein n=1 Tax=Hymenobacter artigasi TaxID=2719616 RepID=A0ABX1HLH4_9BACT|nr:hypothetical protein [Hymenobacter artigasi]NKI91107.1 hypothetical protein [Hymenobacter artigasi]